MGAFVSLAFGWEGSLADCAVLDRALVQAGLQPVSADPPADAMREARWGLSFVGEELPLTSRSYEEEGWVATTLDLDEDLFEEVGNRNGREELGRVLVGVGAALLRQLHLRYVFFDEEAEADIPPWEYHANTLFGITLVADGVPGLEEAERRPDVQRVERFEGGVVLYRRLDPVPHYISTDRTQR